MLTNGVSLRFYLCQLLFNSNIFSICAILCVSRFVLLCAGQSAVVAKMCRRVSIAPLVEAIGDDIAVYLAISSIAYILGASFSSLCIDLRGWGGTKKALYRIQCFLFSI